MNTPDNTQGSVQEKTAQNAIDEDASNYYDPMIYDVMRESGNRLGGKFVALERAAKTPQEAAAFKAAYFGLDAEIDSVDADSLEAVQEKTREFTERLNAIRTGIWGDK